jgi:hypothetical protein
MSLEWERALPNPPVGGAKLSPIPNGLYTRQDLIYRIDFPRKSPKFATTRHRFQNKAQYPSLKGI